MKQTRIKPLRPEKVESVSKYKTIVILYNLQRAI